MSCAGDAGQSSACVGYWLMQHAMAAPDRWEACHAQARHLSPSCSFLAADAWSSKRLYGRVLDCLSALHSQLIGIQVEAERLLTLLSGACPSKCLAPQESPEQECAAAVF